jgi:hypothetical protein
MIGTRYSGDAMTAKVREASPKKLAFPFLRLKLVFKVVAVLLVKASHFSKDTFTP